MTKHFLPSYWCPHLTAWLWTYVCIYTCKINIALSFTRQNICMFVIHKKWHKIMALLHLATVATNQDWSLTFLYTGELLSSSCELWLLPRCAAVFVYSSWSFFLVSSSESCATLFTFVSDWSWLLREESININVYHCNQLIQLCKSVSVFKISHHVNSC